MLKQNGSIDCALQIVANKHQGYADDDIFIYMYTYYILIYIYTRVYIL